eukprot:TRINITY_DN2667_c0_g4_i1.p1 TRINITY_DN2667_c0_g4~~TRINITY_DN2667_c0_g4_i1.p1  ORF type:complete len:539 (-),score=141.46 TRINITY_DN2667_c0_g4_i1:288-1904(-)
MGSCLSSAKTAGESLKASFPVNGEKPSEPSSKRDHTSIPSIPSVGGKKQVPSNLLGNPLQNVEDDYVLGKELGRGLFGITKEAVEKKSGKKYACKSINKHRLSPSHYGSVKREVEILRHVSNHPNIAQLVAAYEDVDRCHFIMELCTGGMLYDSITARGRFSEKQAATIVRTMVMIIEYLNSKGVMHRDLKLENFLLATPDEDAPLKAIDFGLSAFFKPEEQFDEIVGSAYYVAPEVLRRKYGPECDIWSAGVILYMLLCGVPPFWDVSEAGICAAVLKGKYDMTSEPWPKISNEAKELLKRMLTYDPSKRITAAEILRHEWVREDGVASDKPLPSTVLVRVQKFLRFNRMKRKALQVVAQYCLDPDEMGYIRAKFDRFDENADGLLSFEDLRDGLKKLKAPVDDDDIRQMFEAADVDNNGLLDFPEYASAIMVKRFDEIRLRRAFDAFDRQKKGYVTAEDIQMTLKEAEAEVASILQEVDKNNDGKIDYDEFKSMMEDGMDGGIFKGGTPLTKLTESRLAEFYKCQVDPPPGTGPAS